MKISKGIMSMIIIMLIIIIDQVLKVWVKTNFYYGEELYITEWFRLLFIENNGMAFGIELINKFVLTLFRVVMAFVFIYFLYRIRQSSISRGFFVCVSLITAGTIGNAIDCMFYGVIFNNPVFPEVATMFPDGGGYASLFYGKVVDMLYFPLVEWNWPEWIPFIGGDHFLFFHPIFNIADSALCVGIFLLILFYSKDLSEAMALISRKKDSEDEQND